MNKAAVSLEVSESNGVSDGKCLPERVDTVARVGTSGFILLQSSLRGFGLWAGGCGRSRSTKTAEAKATLLHQSVYRY